MKGSRTIGAFIRAIKKRPSSGCPVVIDDDGVGHLKGGYARAFEQGASTDRMAFGYTKADVEGLRKIMARNAGWKDGGRHIDRYCDLDTAEAILTQYLATGILNGKTDAEKQRKRRANLPAGACIVGHKDGRGSYIRARKGMRTCADCSKAAALRVAARRERIKDLRTLDNIEI